MGMEKGWFFYCLRRRNTFAFSLFFSFVLYLSILCKDIPRNYKTASHIFLRSIFICHAFFPSLFFLRNFPILPLPLPPLPSPCPLQQENSAGLIRICYQMTQQNRTCALLITCESCRATRAFGLAACNVATVWSCVKEMKKNPHWVIHERKLIRWMCAFIYYLDMIWIQFEITKFYQQWIELIFCMLLSGK